MQFHVTRHHVLYSVEFWRYMNDTWRQRDMPCLEVDWSDWHASSRYSSFDDDKLSLVTRGIDGDGETGYCGGYLYWSTGCSRAVHARCHSSSSTAMRQSNYNNSQTADLRRPVTDKKNGERARLRVPKLLDICRLQCLTLYRMVMPIGTPFLKEKINN